MSQSTTFRPTVQSRGPGGIRILACRHAPARTITVLALSATVVALGPGAALGADAEPLVTGVSTVRFEPIEPGAGLTIAGIGTYRGVVEVRRNGGTLVVIDEVGVEDYVRGIDEVPPSWPTAVLQAQAVAARTYALNKATTREQTPWRALGADICATATCQVYNGMAAERRAQGYGWLAAVEATAGQVLVSGGRPLFASYSATVNGPMAMSQNGAYAMALEGRSAGDILAAYYGGIRPSTPPRGQFPGTLRVVLATATGSVRVSSTGAFRVVGGDGVELATAPAGGGEWRAVPGPGGVSVIPPATFQGRAATVDAPVVAAALPRPGRAVTAGAPLPRRGPWVLAAALVLGLAGATTATAAARRRGSAGVAWG